MSHHRWLLLSIGGIVLLAFGAQSALTCGAEDKPAKPAAGKGKTSIADKKDRKTEDAPADAEPGPDEKVVKTDAEWRKMLTPLQFRVTRKKGTEIAGTGIYAKSKKDGIYRCVCCGQPLFDSKTKFESGTGWPSFYEPLSEKAVTYIEDRSAGDVRIEVECSRCDAHLGHVFADGPQPTGQRFCMNSASLKLVPRNASEKEAKPGDSKAKPEKGTRDRAPVKKADPPGESKDR